MQSFLKSGAAVLFDQSLRRYFTGFLSSAGVAILIGNEKFLIIDDRYIAAAKKSANAIVLPHSESALFDLLRSKNISIVGLILSKTTAGEYLKIKEQGFEIIDISDKIFEITAQKTENAIKNIKKACKISVTAFRQSLMHLKYGITEKDFARRLEDNMLELGADGKAFESIVAFGKNTAVPHHQSGKTKLKGGAVLIDFGAKKIGFCSDLTRTMYFGSPNAEFKAAYFSVLAAHKAAAESIKIGQSADKADSVARKVLEKAGLEKYFTHSLGHGLGLDIHEPPYLKKGSADRLNLNSIFTIEPGVYFENKFGIRIEDTFKLCENGAKSLIHLTKQIYII